MSYILNYHDSDKVAESSEGAYIWINGRRLIDLSLGNGTHILGHNPHLYVSGGSLFGLKSKYEDEYGDLLHEYTKFESFVLCNSGAEATMRAARIARAFTRRDRIAVFEGRWHGGCDTFLRCDGVPNGIRELTTILPDNLMSLKQISRGNYAMVMVEPVQGALPVADKEWLVALRNACDAGGALLAFDDMICGFRIARGGSRELFGVVPDLATYGKIAGGGFPVGIVAGRKDVMSVNLDGVRMGGTFSGNPATIQAGIDVLSQLTEDKYKYLNEQGKRLRKSVKRPMVGVGSFNRVLFTDKKVHTRAERDAKENPIERERFYKEAFKKGVYIGVNGLQFLSTAHLPGIVDEVIDVFNSI